MTTDDMWRSLQGLPQPMPEIKKGIPIPPQILVGRRHPLTNLLCDMEIGDCIDLAVPKTPKAKSDIYTKAKTARVKVTMRTIDDNGAKILRVWRTE